MRRHAAALFEHPVVRVLLSWVWPTLLVLILSLALISMGSRLPSEQPSIVVVGPLQHYVCMSDVDGTLQGCVLNAPVPLQN